MEHSDFCPCASCSSQSRVLREMARAAEIERQRQAEADYRAALNNKDLIMAYSSHNERADFRRFYAGVEA